MHLQARYCISIKWGMTVFKISFGEVYRRIYGRKFSFTATSTVSSQIKVLQAARHPTKCDVINEVKLFRQYCRKCLTLSN